MSRGPGHRFLDAGPHLPALRLVGSRRSGRLAARLLVAAFALLAALFNLYIPDTGADYGDQHRQPVVLVREFGHCFMTLWRDRLGQISRRVGTMANAVYLVVAGYALDLRQLGVRLDAPP